MLDIELPWVFTVSVSDVTAAPVANRADPSELKTWLSSCVTSVLSVEMSPSFDVTWLVRLLRAVVVAICELPLESNTTPFNDVTSELTVVRVPLILVTVVSSALNDAAVASLALPSLLKTCASRFVIEV